MRNSILIGCATLVAMGLIACGGESKPESKTGNASLSKQEAAKQAKSDGSRDYCAEFGWYNDGECDIFCLQPDDDCAQDGRAAPKDCQDHGGKCVAVRPGACPGDAWGSLNEYTCGSGFGVGCCLDGVEDVDGGQGPVDSDGGQAPTACSLAGGECKAVTPTSCANGVWGDMQNHSCGGGIGVGCCLGQPQDDVDGGQGPVDPGPATTACELKGGECKPVTPTSCADGVWGNIQTHSCGGGFGIGCCMP